MSKKIAELQKTAEETRLATEKTKRKRRKITVSVTAIIAIITSFIIVLTSVIIPTNKYNNAVELLKTSNYDQAYAILEELGDFKDSKEQLVTNKYQRAMKYLDEKDYDKAMPLFDEISNYGNSSKNNSEISEKIIEGKYQLAVSLIGSKKYSEAITVLSSISGYNDSSKKIEQAKNAQVLQSISAANIGSIVKFGNYKQSSNGDVKEIEWYVLDKQNGKALLISKYGLDSEPFYDSEASATGWENSHMREWLNSRFYNDAFTSDEKGSICSTVLQNPASSYGYGRNDDTTDKVFLLSVSEATRLLSSGVISAISGSEYAKKITNSSNIYFLRTAGDKPDCVACVDYKGDISDTGLLGYVSGIYKCELLIRPAIWLNISE